MSVQSVMDDTREIVCVETTGGQRVGEVGCYGITRIECYREAGDGGYVPWFAFYRGDFLAHRCSGRDVRVDYRGPESDAF